MKVLFAVHDENVSLSIVKKYQKEYKEIISYKNVYYFNATFKEIQRDKSYDRIIIDEDLEEYTNTSYEDRDKFLFNQLDRITDESSNNSGKDIPIILICSERRNKAEDFFVKIFGIGIYNAIIGNDRSTDEVCRLINSPRSKKEAKSYYKIDSKKVDYDPEDENDVSEEEMQHILSYFKKLGKNADKYDECFRKISSQYNEQQMKIIVAILPKNVKEILQDVSTEYQKYMPKSNAKNLKISKTKSKKIQEIKPTSEKLLESKNKNNKKQIVVPSSIDKNLIKKVTIKKASNINVDDDDFDDDFDDFDEEEVATQAPKRRGRPSKKLKDEIDEIPSKKISIKQPKFIEDDELEDEQMDISQIDNEIGGVLPGFDDDDSINEDKYQPIDESLLRPEPIIDDKLPGLEDDEEDDDDDNDDIEEINESEETETKKPDYDTEEIDNEDDQDEDDEEDDSDISERNNYTSDYVSNYSQDNYKFEQANPQISGREIQSYEHSYNEYDYTNYNNLLSSERKVIAFVGTSKNGTSFIINNIANILSENGINTAILDTTQNKNSYYIYNNNEDSLRNDAAVSIENLIQGQPGGMSVSKNLTVYVEVPGQNSTRINEVGPILENLAKNHSATLIDCDFSTPYEYFANAQEIYLIQSMDVLTIQPLTAFLKELKNRDILDQQKIRIIINKALKLKGTSSKQIVGGMSRYNNPEMSMMTELFDRDNIEAIEIPFDVEVYVKYLEGLAECSISTSKYPKDFQNMLNKLSNVIYPLLPGRKSKGKNKNVDQYNNGYNNGFSNNVNNTLNNMRKKY